MQPLCVLVQLDTLYTGPSFLENMERVVPIYGTQTRGFRVGKTRLQRDQIPLQVCWALSIHKSQGMTAGPEKRVHRLVIDIGTSDWCAGLAYVALSRSESLACLALHPLHTYVGRWKRLGTTASCKRQRIWVARLHMHANRQHRETCKIANCNICHSIWAAWCVAAIGNE